MKKLLVTMIVVVGMMSMMLTGCGSSSSGSSDSDDSSKKATEAASDEPKSLEIVDSGYTITGGDGDFYIQYGILIKNPNKNYYCDYPEFRIIAEDEDGEVLDTEEQTLNQINAGETIGCAFQACNTDQKPAKVEFEIIEEDDIWTKGTLDDLKLSAESTKISKDEYMGKLSGKLKNDSDKKYDEIAVSIIFRDEDGKITGGDTTYVDGVKANGTTAFSDDLLDAEYMTDDYEIYFENWE